MNPVTRLQAGWRLRLRIEHAQRRPPDQPPATRRFRGVDSRLAPGDAHASARNQPPGCSQAGNLQRVRQSTEIGKSCRETEETYEVRRRGMESNDVVDADVVVRRYVPEV